MTVNKDIKNKIDNLQVWDDLISKYTLESIDSDIYIFSENETFKTVYMWESEIFDLLFSEYEDEQSNKKQD